MKKMISLLLALALCAALLAGCGSPAPSGASSASAQSAASESEPQQAAQRTAFRIASLKGPTTMGLVGLMDSVDKGEARHDYEVTMYGAADEITPLLVKGEVDVALVPCNLASVLYNKMKETGGVEVAAINTLGVLYIVTTGDDIASVADLAGKTIYSTGKGTTPEYTLNYILEQNGLVPGEDVTVEYKSEATEVVSAMQMSSDSALVTGVVLARTQFVEENEAAFEEFLEDYAASVEFVNANTQDAAALVAQYGIVPKAEVAEKALPACNITFITGSDMKAKVSGYLNVLYEQNAQAVGGQMPGDDFYYGA